nr:MAG TPA: portal protein [Caudoviricetes sp.]
MGWLSSLSPQGGGAVSSRPRADGGVVSVETLDLTSERLAEFLRGEMESSSGAVITPASALRTATAYRCVNIINSAIKSLPLDLKRRIDNKRVDADDSPLWALLRKKPNNWQTPSEFKALMQIMVLLRGNGYALKVKSLGKIKQLIPLVGAMRVVQNADLSLSYTYTTRAGTQIPLDQGDVFHLRGMSLDGVVGLSVLSFARESLGLSLSAEKFASKLFKNGAVVGGTLSHPKTIGDPELDRLKASLEEFRGAENAHKMLVLEDGIKYDKIALSSVDAQLLQVMELTQTEIAMFFGVPPFMLGLTTKTTSWGSGIEQQGIGFVAYTLQDWLTMWEETIARDLIGDSDPQLYVRLNPAGLIRGDIKTRYAAYAIGRQWGWLSANDVREKEDMDPIEGGDTYMVPLNMIPAADAAAAALAGIGHNNGPALDDPEEPDDEPPSDPTKQ